MEGAFIHVSVFFVLNQEAGGQSSSKFSLHQSIEMHLSVQSNVILKTYLNMGNWQMQFLDRYHLLIKFGSVDGVVSGLD